jgi:hypothetical protein
MEKPDVDRIDGIAPAIAIRQKNSIRNPRSTVGTTTEIHDYMRLLYARIGRTFCRACGREVVRETAEVVARRLGDLPSGTRLLLGFDLPVVEPLGTQGAESPEVDELHELGDQPPTDSRGPGAVAPDVLSGSQRPASLPTVAKEPAGAAPTPAAVTSVIGNLRRKGFGRLLIDNQALAFDDVEPGRGHESAVDRLHRDRVPRRRRCGLGD